MGKHPFSPQWTGPTHNVPGNDHLSNCRIALTVMDHLGGFIKHLISLISRVTNNSLTLARNVGKLLEFGQNAGEIILCCNFTRYYLITHTHPVNSNFLLLFSDNRPLIMDVSANAGEKSG